ncbi:MAG TPA: hypothetical protein VK745_24975 [Polyangiaceae bacterium]|jgi:hypothetical protein|nr:hypothetical protein [Polyangiaceae bacterium]
MLGRFFIAAFTCAGLLLGVGCGTTTTVSTPAPFDAGCADPSVIEDAGDSIAVPDAGAPQCPSGICNYQAQTGCPADQACRPQFNAVSPDVSPGCEAAGTGKSGATCATGSDCASGYYCADNVCRKQCCAGDWSVCDTGESCFRSLEVKAGGNVIDSGMALCFPVDGCDPLDPSSCPGAPAQGCRIVDSQGSTACVPVGTAQPGDTCATANTCAAGSICSLGACRALCRADVCGEPACTASQGLCIRYSRDPAGVGECTPE